MHQFWVVLKCWKAYKTKQKPDNASSTQNQFILSKKTRICKIVHICHQPHVHVIVRFLILNVYNDSNNILCLSASILLWQMSQHILMLNILDILPCQSLLFFQPYSYNNYSMT